ncbi:hypothetical protein HDU76_013671 [Blyttiomyces sp. JEL0837]|nr:hypothetical protein HDU76_013671 [Blyttiomyces sp. JEL0837]
MEDTKTTLNEGLHQRTTAKTTVEEKHHDPSPKRRSSTTHHQHHHQHDHHHPRHPRHNRHRHHSTIKPHHPYYTYPRLILFVLFNTITALSILAFEIPSTPLYYISYTAYRYYIRQVQQIFGTAVVIGTWIMCPGTTFVLSGEKVAFDALKTDLRSVVIANHQIYPDWFFIWALAWIGRRHGDLMIMLIKILKKLPIFGLAMQYFEFIFMTQKWEKDKLNVQRILGKMNNPKIPLWLLIFPEGTLNTPLNIQKSREFAKKRNIQTHPSHMILPKSTGLHASLQTLKSTTNSLIDLTIGYSGLDAGEIPYDAYLVDRVFGMGIYPKELHIKLRHYQVDKLPGLTSDEEKEKFDNWLRELYMEKDLDMERFYSVGSFDLEGEDEKVKEGNLVERVEIRPRLEDWVRFCGAWGGLYFVAPFYWWVLVLGPLKVVYWVALGLVGLWS